MKKSLLRLSLTLACALTASAADENFSRYYGPKFSPGIAIAGPEAPTTGLEAIRRWNTIAINATGLDHTPVEPGDPRVFGEQIGPCRAARAMAIVHMAMFDAINGLTGDGASFSNVVPPGPRTSTDAAIAQAAHDTLAALFPSQTSTFDAALAEDLAVIVRPTPRQNGVTFGQAIAAAILAERATDGSNHPEPLLGPDWTTSDQPGHWRQDPISQIPVALGAHWGKCRPIVLPSVVPYRVPAPPAMTSQEYASAFREAKWLGGDGITTATSRTPEQTFIGIFWAYDGTPSLCAPPRLYNQILMTIADQTDLSGLLLARLLALANVAMADEAIAAWDSKYHWDLWRPVTGIREADVGTGPTGLGDGNPRTLGDVTFMPLGAPASNLMGPNFTPPFPTYPSGHASFGGALFQVLRRFYGRDDIPFTFVSDEFNGMTRANDGTVRPLIPRHFNTFSEAELENGLSRIYLGIHWNFDASAGIAQGRQVGDYVYDNALARPFPLAPQGPAQSAIDTATASIRTSSR